MGKRWYLRVRHLSLRSKYSSDPRWQRFSSWLPRDLVESVQEAQYDEYPEPSSAVGGAGSPRTARSRSASPVFRLSSERQVLEEGGSLRPVHRSGRREVPTAAGTVVRVSSRANPEYQLSVRNREVVLCPRQSWDDRQVWIRDNSCWGAPVQDEGGHPAFALINKATGLALQHASPDEGHQVRLKEYSATEADASLLWTEGKEIRGSGYRAVRHANDVSLNLDAWKAVPHYGGVRDGNPVVVFKWNKGWNQQWNIHPVPH